MSKLFQKSLLTSPAVGGAALAISGAALAAETPELIEPATESFDLTESLEISQPAVSNVAVASVGRVSEPEANLAMASHSSSEDVLTQISAYDNDAAQLAQVTLRYLRTQGHTRCVLGLHDVLDEPIVVHWDWSRSANEKTIRDYYDAVWIYRNATGYKTVDEYGFSHDIAAKIRYIGYLDQPSGTGSVWI
ncbi:MAG: hypothetical protein QNJ46_33010 [Leptolyngbyaceae cyanobacterium MO_188.B28]|nr:hypothetical protein [Leptolyngbyaceae cyanobacterium MO_188.B28]